MKRLLILLCSGFVLLTGCNAQNMLQPASANNLKTVRFTPGSSGGPGTSAPAPKSSSVATPDGEQPQDTGSGGWVDWGNGGGDGTYYYDPGTQQAPQVTDTPIYINEPGNSADNINVGGGLAAMKGEWTYYKNFSDGGVLYKEKYDGTERIRLTDAPVSNINVVGDWVYYVNANANNNIYKVRTDGTGNTLFVQTNAARVYSMGYWIYFVDKFGSLYRINIDGSGHSNVNDSVYGADMFSIVGDYIYFKQGNMFYRMNTDGSGKMLFSTSLNYVISYSATYNWIYFSTSSGNSNLSRIQTDGNHYNELETISWPYLNNNIQAVGEWVYFHDNSNSIYKIHPDGTGKTLIVGSTSANPRINIAGYWLYYFDSFGIFCRISVDGQYNQQVR